MNYMNILIVLLGSSILFSCQSTSNECLYEEPSAIFNNIPEIKTLSFSKNGQTGIEKVHIPSLHLDLELIQSGCKTLKQECRFILHGTYPQDAVAPECAKDLATILYNISTFDTKLSEFSDWAEMLFKKSSEFSYDKAILMPESGIRASIMKQHLPKKTILTLTIQ